MPVTPGTTAEALTSAESPPPVAGREELHHGQNADDDQKADADQQSSSSYSGNQADDRADDDQQVKQENSSKAVNVSCGGESRSVTAADESIAVPGRGEPDHATLATLKAIVEEGVVKHGGSKDVAAAFDDLKVHLEGVLQQVDTASDNSNALVTALSLFFGRWTPARGEWKAMSAEEWDR